MGKDNTTNKNQTYYIHSVIMIAIMLLFKFLPVIEPMTRQGMEMLGIMLGAIYGWCTVDIIWPSFLGLLMLMFTGAGTGRDILIKLFSNDNTILVLSMLLFSGMINITGIAKVIALKLINLKCNNGRPWMLSFFLLLAALLAGAVITPVPTILIIWDIIYVICDVVGLKKGDKWPAAIIFGTALTATIGLQLFPFSTAVTAVVAVVLALDPTVAVPYGAYFLFSIVYCAACMAIILLVMRFILSPDTSKLKNYEVSTEKIALTKQQRFIFFMMILMIVLLMLPGLLPTTMKLQQILANISNPGIIIMILMVCLFLRNKDGERVINFSSIAQAGVSWEMLIMIGTAFTIASSLGDPATGFGDMIIRLMEPICQAASPWLFCAIVCVFTLLLTNVLDNAIVGFAVTPIAYTVADQMGANSLMLLVLIIYLCEIGTLFPASSATGALVHSNKEWLTKKQVFAYSGIMILELILVTFVVGIPLGNILF